VNDILKHPWFAEIDIDSILSKKEVSPYIPKIEGIKDLSNFDPEITS
jgi:hypothetical protein